MKAIQKTSAIEALKKLQAPQGLGNVAFTPKPVIKEVLMLESPYTDDVYIRTTYIDVLADSSAVEKITYTRIDPQGKTHTEAQRSMHFKTLEDRVHFFNTLTKIIL